MLPFGFLSFLTIVIVFCEVKNNMKAYQKEQDVFFRGYGWMYSWTEVKCPATNVVFNCVSNAVITFLIIWLNISSVMLQIVNTCLTEYLWAPESISREGLWHICWQSDCKPNLFLLDYLKPLQKYWCLLNGINLAPHSKRNPSGSSDLVPVNCAAASFPARCCLSPRLEITVLLLVSLCQDLFDSHSGCHGGTAS